MYNNVPVVVTYEDRISGLIGVEILAKSLAKHAPLMKIRIYSPLPEANCLSKSINNLEYVFTDELQGRGWNVKPTTLLWALEDYDRAIWLDTDIVISGNIHGLCSAYPIENITVGQEFRGNKAQGGILRAKQWGFKIGRTIPYHVNSGSLLVSRYHRQLLKDWQSCLLEEKYLIHQTSLSYRPPAFVGDQDVLWALLVCSDHSNVPVSYFKIGRDMLIHCGARGFQIIDRFMNIKSKRPAFIHMLGKYKPWSFEEIPNKKLNRDAYRHAVCFELSPFHAECQSLAEALGYPQWACRRTPEAKFWNTLAFGNVALRGMPLALASWIKDTFCIQFKKA